MPKYRNRGGPVFWDRPSSRYCCYGNCTAGFTPI